MAKKKVSFRSEVLKQEFAATKTTERKAHYKILYAVIAVALCVAVGYFIYARQTELSVDWYEYGKAIANIENDYSDHDRVILKVGDNEITKLEYYKLKLLNDYTFDGLLIEYNEYIEKNGENMTDEEKDDMKPSVIHDDDIINSLIELELGYIEAMETGVYMDYATAYSQVNSSYLTYKSLMEEYEPEDELYQRAEENIRQMELVASGMDKTIDEYLEYLAEDSMKVLAVSMLEGNWQTEFEDSDYDGTFEEYLREKYDMLKGKYDIAEYGLGGK